MAENRSSQIKQALGLICGLLAFGPGLIRAQVTGNSLITEFSTAQWVFTADGARGIDAPLYQVQSLNTDTNGRVIFADPGNHVVLQINSDGTVTVLAGNGLEGFSGDGGPAVAASLNRPSDAVMDGAGNLYIYDEFNYRIREVTPDGIINTILGNGTNSESGDGGPALRATLGGSDRLAVDAAGNLYISNRCQIRRITSDGKISTFAGNTTCTHSGDGTPALQASMNPFGMAFDTYGNLYFTEASQGYVRKIGTDGTVSTITGGLKYPHSVVVDGSGNVFFSDVNKGTVSRVAPDGTVTTFAGVSGQTGYSGDGGPAAQGTLFFPKGVALDGAGNLDVADSGNFRIRRIRGGMIETLVGNGQFRTVPDGTQSGEAYLYGPENLAFDMFGNLLISEVSFSKVAQINAADSSFHVLAGAGIAGYGLAPRNLIYAPRQIATDAEGTVYFVDSANAVAYKMVNGVAQRIAGQFAVHNYTGDNGPATNATLASPFGIAVDASGAIFISDAGAHVIRRVATDGSITTYAGTGKAGFSGDNGPANAAQLNAPNSLAIDLNGNLLICDRGNNRVRKIDLSGTITTIAGNGNPTSSGDGGPATQAAVNSPFAIAADVDGGIFLVTSGGARLRRIDTAGNISTIAGDGIHFANQGDGGPASKALLNVSGIAVDSFGNVFLSSFSDDSIRVILNFEPGLYLAQPSFYEIPSSKIPLPDAIAGGARTPPQPFSVIGDFDGIQFSAAADQPWIVLANTQGTTPATMSFWGDPSKLSTGEYKGNIILTRVGASQLFAKIAVSMNVVAQRPPQLSVQPSSLSLSTAIGAATQPTQTIHILNTGSGSLDYQVTRSSVSANYLRLSPAPLSGTVNAGTPVNLVVSIDPASLSAGTLSETLLIKSSATGQTVSLPVAISVAAKPQRMVLSQRGLTFLAVQNGGVTPQQTFSVLNAGGGSFDWTATAITLGNTPPWLSITPQGGTSVAGSPAPSISVMADPSVLSTPGTYYGLVRVSSPSAANSPQDVEVVLNFVDSSKNLGASVNHSGLIFVAPAGSSSPGSQTITVTDLNAKPLSVSPQTATLEGIPWLTVVPDAAQQSISSGGALKLTVAPKVDSLVPGVHRGTVLLQFPSPLTNLEVDVQFIVTPAGTSGSTTTLPSRKAGLPETTAAACTPKSLVPVFSSLFNNFALPAAWPVALEANVADDCGNPFTSGQVVVSFSNGDPPISLVSQSNGRWQGTWYGSHSGTALQITLGADSASPLLHGEQKYSGLLQPNNGVPAITPGGVGGALNTTAQAAIGPGSIVSISGKSFAATASPGQLPLTTDLSGTEVALAGVSLPLIYAAGGLINAVVPYDFQPGQYLALVMRGGAVSGPEPIVVGTAQPVIFRITTSTDPQVASNIWSQLAAGQAIDPATVSPAGPVTAGSTLMIYCTGLGPVTPAFDSTKPAPSPAPAVANPVTLTIGNTTVPVLSATLVPGYSGIYLVQATVPSGISTGTGVQLAVSVQGQVSAPAGISVQ